MRAEMSTIQQTLTAEAAALLSQAIGEAARRRHGQTTPLHVSVAMLSSPSGLFRQACVRSHPPSSHPLQCRALELCFSVALDRLPSSTPSNSDSPFSSVTEPPISNALLAALKRAQAHQRRGCPEQQQQPLLAVKVELDQLVLSILDDPSVSRVMREASFSSPSVKAKIEQSLSISPTSSSSNTSISKIPFLFPSNSSSAATISGLNPYRFQIRPDEVKRVLEIMVRGKRRNPVLVGDSDPRPILRDAIRRIESGTDPRVPSSLRGAHVISLEKDFAERSRIPAGIRDLGASIEARAGEVGVVLDLGDLKWLVEGHGSAQQQQPVIASETTRSAVVEMAKLLSRFNNSGSQRIWLVGLATCATYLRCQVYHPSVEDDWDLQAAPIAPRSPLPHLFPRLGAKEPLPPVKESKHPLPSWLQIAKEQDHSQPKEQDLKWKQRSADLLKRWQESCSKHHLQSPTVLRDRVNESAGCEQDKAAPCISELDSFKRLFHGLTERVGWQAEAASAIATAVVQCKSGNGKPRPISSKGAIWLLFDGSDKVGKLKMAAALSELMFGATPITIRLAMASPNYVSSNTVLRGKTSMDRVADALCQNPFSVIVIEDINSANNLDRSTLKRAMKTGRLPDSHGREISLESAIFVLLTDEKILESARSGWSLEFTILESVGKRQAEWLCKDEGLTKRSRESPPGLSLDLNLAISTDDEDEDPAEDKQLVIKKLAEPTVAPVSELAMLADEMVLFQPVDFTSVKRKVTEFIRSQFNIIVGHEHSIRVEDDALEKIMAGFWLAGAGVLCNGLEEWAEKMLVPGINQLKTCLEAVAEPVTVQLIAKKVKLDVGQEFLPAVVSVGSITVNGM